MDADQILEPVSALPEANRTVSVIDQQYRMRSYVSNELAHSLDNEKLKVAIEAVRNAYLAVTETSAKSKASGK
jgi:hypothetical protein